MSQKRMPAAPRAVARWFVRACLAGALCGALCGAQTQAVPIAPDPVSTRGADTAAALQRPRPVLFLPNQGQWPASVRFLAWTEGATAWFAARQVELQVQGAASPVRLRPLAANPEPILSPGAPRETRFQFFQGADSRHWRTDVPTYGSLRYAAIYPLTDLVFRAADSQLAYDFIVHPGGDPDRIRVAVEGVTELTLEADGAMIMTLPDGVRIRQAPPLIYQEQAGQREILNGRFRLLAAAETEDAPSFGFAIDAFDPTRTLIIDPILSYSTFVGGSRDDTVGALVANPDGTVIVAGTTASVGFPLFTEEPRILTPGLPPGEEARQAKKDGFIYKLNATGTELSFVTLLAGQGDDEIRGLALDDSGNLYVTGVTTSTDFATANALYRVLPGRSAAFVAKLNATGNRLLFSSYFGGTGADAGRAIALDGATPPNLYVAGVTASPDLLVGQPLRIEGFDGGRPAGRDDGFIASFDHQMTRLRYATYFGGSDADSIDFIEVSPGGDLFIAGQTKSRDLPTRNAVQGALAGGADLFVARIARGGNELVFSTYLGGSRDDILTGMVRDPDGHYLLSGYSNSTDFPLFGALQWLHLGGNDAILAKLDRSGRFLHFSTYLGQLGNDRGLAIATDRAPDPETGFHSIYLAGATDSHAFPVEHPVQAFHAGGGDGFVTKLDPCGQVLYFSSFFGGGAADAITALATRRGGLDSTREVFIAGTTANERNTAWFPVTEHAYGETQAGGVDTFVAHLAGIDNLRNVAELMLSCDPRPVTPEADPGLHRLPFELHLGDPGQVGIVAFRTQIYFDPEVLAIDEIAGVRWEDRAPLNAASTLKRALLLEPGVLELEVLQATTGPALDQSGSRLATLLFNVLDVGSVHEPPKPSRMVSVRLAPQAAAVISGGLDSVISGLPGSRLVLRRANDLIGDCDASGQVQLFEVEARLGYFLDPEAAPGCAKRDYRNVTATDIDELITNYLARYREGEFMPEPAASEPDPIPGRLELVNPRAVEDGLEYDLALAAGSTAISVLALDLFFDPRNIRAIAARPSTAAFQSGKALHTGAAGPGWQRLLFDGINTNPMPSGLIGTLHLTLAPGVECGQIWIGMQADASNARAPVPVTGNAVVGCLPADGFPPNWVSVTTQGAGQVTSRPPGIDCGEFCAAVLGPVVTLTARADPGHRIRAWTGACAATPLPAANARQTATCTLPIYAAMAAGVEFAAQEFTLNLSRSGQGTVISYPVGIDCGRHCAAIFPADTIVRLTASPGRDQRFGGWSGACDGGSPVCHVRMDEARRVTALFEMIPEPPEPPPES